MSRSKHTHGWRIKTPPSKLSIYKGIKPYPKSSISAVHERMWTKTDSSHSRACYSEYLLRWCPVSLHPPGGRCKWQPWGFEVYCRQYQKKGGRRKKVFITTLPVLISVNIQCFNWTVNKKNEFCLDSLNINWISHLF